MISRDVGREARTKGVDRLFRCDGRLSWNTIVSVQFQPFQDLLGLKVRSVDTLSAKPGTVPPSIQ